MADNVNYDDGLQNNPDDTNPVDDMKRDEELPEDNDPPFSEPRAQNGRVSPGHQELDSNIDTDQKYQEGSTAAAEVNPPSSEDVIPGYDPTNGERKGSDGDGPVAA